MSEQIGSRWAQSAATVPEYSPIVEVKTGHGERFAPNDVFLVSKPFLFETASFTDAREACRVLEISGDTLTVERGFAGTPAAEIGDSDALRLIGNLPLTE